MKLYVARHGLTNYNEQQLCNNDPSVDVHLIEPGIQQAKKLAGALKEIPFEIVYTSELKRTKQTAEYVNEFHSVHTVADSRLGDTITGYEGQPTSLYFGELENAEDKWSARFNGGESLEDLKERVKSFINDLAKQDYESVLVVTSQYIVYAFLCWLNDLSNEEAWSSEVLQGSYRVFELPKNTVL